MKPFKAILKQAETRAGGAELLEARLPKPKSARALKAVPDDRYLSLMSLRIFRAGLKHSMVDAKWPAFEGAFKGFEPKRVRALNDEQVEALMRDKRLIRHWGKIKSVRDNAAAICALEEETGGIGSYLGDWPGERIVELWDDLARRFTQLGGNSGPYFLRMAGKDTFLLTGDVVHALNRWGAIEGEPKGKRARRETQPLFNRWAEEAERPLCQISMILAVSVR